MFWKNIANHVQKKDKITSKLPYVCVTTAANIIKTFKGHGTVANLPGLDCKRKTEHMESSDGGKTT